MIAGREQVDFAVKLASFEMKPECIHGTFLFHSLDPLARHSLLVESARHCFESLIVCGFRESACPVDSGLNSDRDSGLGALAEEADDGLSPGISAGGMPLGDIKYQLIPNGQALIVGLAVGGFSLFLEGDRMPN